MRWPFRRKKNNVGALPGSSSADLNLENAESPASVRPQEFRAGRDPRPNDKFIAIMGVTGSGKSSFIELLTGAGVKIGMGLEACTSRIGVYPIDFGPEQTVYLIDTPGFNDTFKSDGQILVEITTWLSNSYNNRVHLNGVIYLHDVTQQKMYGSSLRTLKTFKELSGPDAMKKVILTTTHWDIIHPESLAQTQARERQLIETDEFWGSMVAKGSRVERHDNTKASAERLIRLIVPQSAVTLAVQSQMVDQHLKLSETTAGKTLAMDLIRKMDDNYRQQLEELRLNKKQSEEMRRRHEAELAQMREKLEITSREMTERMNRELEAREARFREQAEAQARREEEFRREQAETYARREEALRRDLEWERQQLREKEWEDVDDEDEDEEDSSDYAHDSDSDDSESGAVVSYNGNNSTDYGNMTWNNNWNTGAFANSSGNGVHIKNNGVYITNSNGGSLRVDNSGVYINGRHVTGNGGQHYSGGSSVNITNDGIIIINGRRIPYNGR
ncbi:P-loop containing nucleoside triphosphate hydrolase protein [Aspergillus terricola var. indicus]